MKQDQKQAESLKDQLATVEELQKLLEEKSELVERVETEARTLQVLVGVMVLCNRFFSSEMVISFYAEGAHGAVGGRARRAADPTGGHDQPPGGVDRGTQPARRALQAAQGSAGRHQEAADPTTRSQRGAQGSVGPFTRIHPISLVRVLKMANNGPYSLLFGRSSV